LGSSQGPEKSNTASKMTNGSPRLYTDGSLGAGAAVSKLMKPEPSMIRKLLAEEKDERYRYLVKHGQLHFVERDSLSLLVELKQIPNIWIIYRRPSERENQPEKMILDGRQLKHVPLLEGEEKVKYLNLANNEIRRIENLVSLPNLNFLDLSQNMLSTINQLTTSSAVLQLRVLILAKNRIETI